MSTLLIFSCHFWHTFCRISMTPSKLSPTFCPMALDISPKEELYFKGPFNCPVTEFLYLQNPTDHRIAFKVKTTAPNRYQVKPVTGFVKPGDFNKVTLILNPLFDKDGKRLGGLFDRSKQKFLVEAAYVEGIDGAVQNILNQARSNGELMQAIFRCIFHEPSSNENISSSSRRKVTSVTEVDQDRTRFNTSPGQNGRQTTPPEGRPNLIIMALGFLLVVYIISLLTRSAEVKK